MSMAYRKADFVLLLLAFLLVSVSCSKSNPQDEDKKLSFQLEQPYKEIMQGSTLRIFITSGSGDLRINNSEDIKSYAKTAYERTPDETDYMGVLSIRALQVGELHIALTDNITKEKQLLTIKILPPYLLLGMMEGSDPVLGNKKGFSGLFLIQNAEHSFYVCPYSSARYRFIGPAILSGQYEIVMKNNIPTNLRLQDKSNGFVRDFNISDENTNETIEILRKLSKSELLPEDGKFNSPFFLDEQDMGFHVAGNMDYKGVTLPEKVMD